MQKNRQRIEELRKQIKTIMHEEINPRSLEISNLEILIATAESIFSVGEIITERRGDKKFQITEIGVWIGSPKIMARQVLKSGGLGSVVRNIYSPVKIQKELDTNAKGK